MKKLLIVTTFLAASLAAQNLTPAQKEADFRFMASQLSTAYAPLDWKKQLLGFDAMQLKPWLDKIAKTTTDLDYYDVCAEYISKLNDTHTWYQIPSDFDAWLGFNVDIYDDALLIDSISRALLPSKDYPFVVGDELISIDGVDAKTMLEGLTKFNAAGNPRASRRLAAEMLTDRYQWSLPHAADIGDSATVVIKRQNGSTETYKIDWYKTGTPVTVGPVPSPTTTAAAAKRAAARTAKAAAAGQPDYMVPLTELQNSSVEPHDPTGVRRWGSQFPIFLEGMPSTFTRRLGSRSTDFFYSGVFKRNELTIGYIRIPNYSPDSTASALKTLDAEIAYMQANTDGLIVDEMRNTGGNLCFGESVATRLIPYTFQATGFQTKPVWARVVSFYNAMISAKAANASPEIIAQYELLYNELAAANKEGRLTRSVPLCTASLTREPLTDAGGKLLAYQKPLMLLIDEFTTSTADSVAGMLQDARRGTIYGIRTNGAGGNNISAPSGPYSEAYLGMTLALQTRKEVFGNPGYPPSIYIENEGVHPNVMADYMTRDNLLHSGAAFVDGFLDHMAAHIREQQK